MACHAHARTPCMCKFIALLHTWIASMRHIMSWLVKGHNHFYAQAWAGMPKVWGQSETIQSLIGYIYIHIYTYIYIYLHNWLHTTQERAIWTQAENIYHRPNHSMFIIQRTLQSLQCSCCCGQAPGAVPMKANWFSIKPGNIISQSCCCFCCWHHCLQNLET